jgi:hypothetical protein
VKEESQIEDMRAALRGDRERAEARRQSTEDVRALIEPAASVPEAETPQSPSRRRGLLDRLLGR